MTRANLSLNKHGLPQKEILRHRKVPVVLAILVMAMFYIVGPILVLISNKDVETASLLHDARTYYIFQNTSMSAAMAGIFGIYLAFEGFRFAASGLLREPAGQPQDPLHRNYGQQLAYL